MNELWRGCENEPITITADPGFIHYDWDNGATGQVIDAFMQGPLRLTVTDLYGCQASKTIQVVTSAEPVISEIVISDWTDHDNSITVYTEQDGTASVQNFEYSLDGLNFQTSNIFNGLDPGKYAVFVRDKYGCGMAPASTYLLTYPRFFTPNGDGQNEKWRIKFSTQAEPDLMVYIYDRYGKLITGFGADSEGWDGTYNGYLLPSTDYWFVVRRQNGKEFKGHFAMIR
jgi:gliding motility-associated-like protein